MATKIVSFKEAVEIAKAVGIVDEKTTHHSVVLVLKDGSCLHFRSEYDGPYSEVTPGNGIEPPTAMHVT